jgi:trehalose/maltose hydrolase-like predicted phosphorylase
VVRHSGSGRWKVRRGAGGQGRNVTVSNQRGDAVYGFSLIYDGFDPGTEGLREALTSTGNGYLCTRGAAEWEDADGVHYPGTYAHGGYNRETTILGGLPVLNEDLVNLPNWLVLELRIEGEDAMRISEIELLGYRHEFDIRNATVVRRLRFRDHCGRETTLTSRRFVSMADAHHAGIEWTLVPENWSGRAEVISAVDGRVSNTGVARYQQLEGRHLNLSRSEIGFGWWPAGIPSLTRRTCTR